MSDETDEHCDKFEEIDEQELDQGKIETINGELLDLIGMAVKLNVILSELSLKELAAVQARYSMFVSAVNSTEIENLITGSVEKH